MKKHVSLIILSLFATSVSANNILPKERYNPLPKAKQAQQKEKEKQETQKGDPNNIFSFKPKPRNEHTDKAHKEAERIKALNQKAIDKNNRVRTTLKTITEPADVKYQFFKVSQHEWAARKKHNERDVVIIANFGDAIHTKLMQTDLMAQATQGFVNNGQIKTTLLDSGATRMEIRLVKMTN